ncbi:MAG: hypothetical protein RMY36_025630 [Nostoc sp. SerVER01]
MDVDEILKRIEDEWLHLKRYELSSQIFDDIVLLPDHGDAIYGQDWF